MADKLDLVGKLLKSSMRGLGGPKNTDFHWIEQSHLF